MKPTLHQLTPESISLGDNQIEISDCVTIWHFDEMDKEDPYIGEGVYPTKDDAIILANLITEAIRIGYDINPDNPIAGIQDAHQSYKFFLQKLEEDKPAPNTHTFITNHQGGRKHTYATKPAQS